jgi:hypothetical protein
MDDDRLLCMPRRQLCDERGAVLQWTKAVVLAIPSSLAKHDQGPLSVG